MTVYIKYRRPTRTILNSTHFERWSRTKHDFSHLRTFGCLTLPRSMETSGSNSIVTHTGASYSDIRRCIPVSSYEYHFSRIFIPRDIKFRESVLYFQMLKSPQGTKVNLDPAKEPLYASSYDPPDVRKTEAEVQPPKQLPKVSGQYPAIHPINPTDHSDDELTPPLEEPSPNKYS